MRIKLTIEYDGTNFAGWQQQANVYSVQQAIQDAIKELTKQNVTLHCCGRTDAGVHALQQVAHFDLPKNSNIELKKLRPGINHYLIQNSKSSNQVSITNAKMVEDGFHARFNTKKRAYKYKILNRNAPPAILYNRVWHIKTPLDIDNMQQCGNILLGTHDFSSFRAAECQAQTPIKTLDKIKVSVESDIISIYVEAKSFLHHMVRNIVGTLYLAGSKKITPTDMQKILLAKDRSRAGQTAPACGLYFYKVWY